MTSVIALFFYLLYSLALVFVLGDVVDPSTHTIFESTGLYDVTFTAPTFPEVDWNLSVTMGKTNASYELLVIDFQPYDQTIQNCTENQLGVCGFTQCSTLDQRYTGYAYADYFNQSTNWPSWSAAVGNNLFNTYSSDAGNYMATFVGDIDMFLGCLQNNNQSIWLHSTSGNYAYINTTMYITNLRPVDIHDASKGQSADTSAFPLTIRVDNQYLGVFYGTSVQRVAMQLQKVALVPTSDTQYDLQLQFSTTTYYETTVDPQAIMLKNPPATFDQPSPFLLNLTNGYNYSQNANQSIFSGLPNAPQIAKCTVQTGSSFSSCQQDWIVMYHVTTDVSSRTMLSMIMYFDFDLYSCPTTGCVPMGLADSIRIPFSVQYTPTIMLTSTVDIDTTLYSVTRNQILQDAVRFDERVTFVSQIRGSNRNTFRLEIDGMRFCYEPTPDAYGLVSAYTQGLEAAAPDLILTGCYNTSIPSDYYGVIVAGAYEADGVTPGPGFGNIQNSLDPTMPYMRNISFSNEALAFRNGDWYFTLIYRLTDVNALASETPIHAQNTQPMGGLLRFTSSGCPRGTAFDHQYRTCLCNNGGVYLLSSGQCLLDAPSVSSLPTRSTSLWATIFGCVVVSVSLTGLLIVSCLAIFLPDALRSFVLQRSEPEKSE